MKYYHFLPALLLLTACYQSADETLVEGNTQTVNFRISAFGVDQGALTRADFTPSKLLVIDCHGGKADTYTQESLAEIPIPLAYGQHDLYFVASSTAWTNYDAQALTVTWPVTRGGLEFVWAKKLTLNVSASTGGQEVTMPLLTADVKVTTLDYLPTTIGDFVIEAPDLCHGLNLSDMTGYSLGQTVTHTLDCRSGATGTKTLTTNIYTLVPSTESVGDITLTAYNASTSAEIASHVLDDVPVKAGYISYYKGYFFSEGVAISFSCADQWTGTNDYNF